MFNYTAGTPFTNYDYSIRKMVGEFQDQRSPYTMNLDLRLEKDFRIKGKTLRFMVDGFNVTNRENIFETVADISNRIGEYGSPYRRRPAENHPAGGAVRVLTLPVPLTEGRLGPALGSFCPAASRRWHKTAPAAVPLLNYALPLVSPSGARRESVAAAVHRFKNACYSLAHSFARRCGWETIN